MRITPDVHMVGSGALGLSALKDCHVYLLDGGSELALIDAGVGLEPGRIIEAIRQEGYDERTIKYLFLTHSHADHAGGAKAMKELTGAQIVCSAVAGQLLAAGSDKALGLDRARRSGIYPPDYIYQHVEPDAILEHQQELILGKFNVRAIEVRGHSPCSLCYLVAGDDHRMLFCGDVVFHGGTIGLGNWAGSSLEDYRRYIGRLSGLAVEGLYPGHFLWTLRGGQEHLDTAVANMALAWVPPAWQHQHPHR